MNYHTRLLLASLVCYGLIVLIRLIAMIARLRPNAVINIVFCLLIFLLIPLSLVFHDLCPAPFGASRPPRLQRWQRLKYLLGAFLMMIGGGFVAAAILILVEHQDPWVSLGIDFGLGVVAYGFYLCRVNRGLPQSKSHRTELMYC